MSDPLALLPLAIAAGGGRLGSFEASQLVAAGLTLLQRSASLVRALSGKRSAIFLPNGPAFLVALAASDGRGALLLDMGESPDEIARQLTDADVGAVFTLEALAARLPEGMSVVLLDDAPRLARVIVPGRTHDVDLGSHHGLALEGDTTTEGRDEECIAVYGASRRRDVLTHRDLLSAGRAAVAELLLTPVDHVLALAPCSDPDALVVCLAAPLLAGARVSFLSPADPADVFTGIEQNDVSMLAGRWRTTAGLRVTAHGVSTALQQLRDGQLILA